MANAHRHMELPVERREKVGKILFERGKITVGDVVQEFAVSVDTARRDLKELELAGLCKCVYGGALLVSPSPHLVSISAAERRTADSGRKEKLGRALAGLVKPGQVVFIDAGSTNHAAARHLPDVAGLTVITHDPGIASALVAFQNIRLICIGGTIDHHVGAAVDASAMRSIRGLRPDLLLLGSCALDPEQGLSAFSYEDAQIKSCLVENSSCVATAILNEKLNATASFGICPLGSVATLVLEPDAPVDAVAACRRKARQLLLAD